MEKGGNVSQETVLVIDDDKVGTRFVCNALAPHYNMLAAENGQEGIRLALEHRPDLILLDVEMPGMSGYQTCEILKCESLTHQTPIVFISANAGIRERMLGYELGAEDFIAKPFEPGELVYKLKKMTTRLKTQQDLSERADMATRTAMTVMAGNSELGAVIQFVEFSYAANSCEELAQRFLRVMDSFGLSCGLLFITASGNRFFASRGDLKPMEEELMVALHAKGQRFCDFGCRTQVNYSRIALLVKNMPLEDRDRYGRLKDLFPSMLGAADAKVNGLDTEQAMLTQTQDLVRSFKIVETTLAEQSASLQMNQEHVVRVIHSLWGSVEAKLPTLGLDEDQESFLMTHLDGALHEARDVLENSSMLRGSFDSVMRLLKHLTDRQQRIVDEFMVRHVPDDAASAPSAEEDVGSDIELF